MPAIISDRGVHRAMTRALAAIRILPVAMLLWPIMPAVAAAPPSIGQVAPALITQSFGGAPLDLGALHGKVVVLNFWASWCVPCRQEMPLLDQLYRDYRDRGLVVLGISADDPHDRRDAQRAAQALSYPTGMLSAATVNGFGAVQALPLSFVIGRDGLISAILRANQGAVSAEQLRGVVLRELERSAP